MKVVIFAGGRGTRLSELTERVPKPMVTVGGIPILMHIMDIYARQGHCEFIVCGGYRVKYIASYFEQIGTLDSEGRYCLRSISGKNIWVRVCDTGENVNTATRLKAIRAFVGDEDFMLTYADGLANVHTDELIQRHKELKSIVTVTAVEKTDNFGIIETSDEKTVRAFHEKSVMRLINGGYMICQSLVFDYLPKEDLPFEIAVLPQLAKIARLAMYKHNGFWKCMDSLMDKEQLDEIAESGNEPWFNSI